MTPDGDCASCVIGVGAGSAATAAEVALLVDDALAVAGLRPGDVHSVATAEGRTDRPAITALPWPVVGVPIGRLADTAVPNPSAPVARAVGSASVAEAAALRAAGPGSRLIVAKTRSAHATVAIAAIHPSLDPDPTGPAAAHGFATPDLATPDLATLPLPLPDHPEDHR